MRLFTGACRWSASTGTCSASLAYEGQVIAAPGVDNQRARSDPVCLLFLQYATSGCQDIRTRIRCERNRLCYWSSRIGKLPLLINVERLVVL